MIMLDNDQIEVIQVENLALRSVHIDFYKKHWEKFIPSDEYYTMDEHGFSVINLDRLEKHRKAIQKKDKGNKDK